MTTLKDPLDVIARIKEGAQLCADFEQRQPWYLRDTPFLVGARAVRALEQCGWIDTSPCRDRPGTPALLAIPKQILGLTADEHKAVEELFAQDMPDAPTPDVPPAVRRTLVKKGFVEVLAREGRDKLGQFSIPTPALTRAGHMAYCEWADEVTPDEEPPDA